MHKSRGALAKLDVFVLAGAPLDTKGMLSVEKGTIFQLSVWNINGIIFEGQRNCLTEEEHIWGSNADCVQRTSGCLTTDAYEWVVPFSFTVKL